MPRPGTMLYLVTYDMPSSPAGDRRRARLARYLEGLGLRVQMSVFELELPPLRLPVVCAEIENRIDSAEDSVRIYPLCGTCSAKVARLGSQAPVEHAALIIW